MSIQDIMSSSLNGSEASSHLISLEPFEVSELSLTSSLSSSSSSSYPLSYFITSYWDNDCDSRVDGFPLMSYPWTMVLIVTLYVTFVKYLGPKWMANREPFQLRGPMFVYNVLMVIINAYFLIEACIGLRYGLMLLKFDFPDKQDTSEFTLRVIRSSYLYYLTKYVDLLDTVFFVLRKKYSQISVLHLYHHASVPALGWLAIKVGPTCPGLLLFATINSLVHVVMYAYYALAALGPEIQKYLWWKKYITQLQLGQFVILGLYGVLVAKFQTGYEPAFLYLGCSQPPIFFWMFFDFYRQSYNRNKQKQQQIKQQKTQ